LRTFTHTPHDIIGKKHARPLSPPSPTSRECVRCVQSELERCDLRATLRNSDVLILSKDARLAARDVTICELTAAADEAREVAKHARKGEEDIKGAMLAQGERLRHTQNSLEKMKVTLSALCVLQHCS
jgi:hypothetical protein